MDLKLNITKKEGTNMLGLVKQMCALKCRIKVDINQGEVSIVGIDDDRVENVINSIEDAFNIVGIDIVPTVEVPEPVITAESLEIAKIEYSNKEVEDQVNKLMRSIYWAMYSCNAQTQDICNYLKATGREISMKYDRSEQVKYSVGDIVSCNYGNHPSGEVSGGYVHSIVCDIDEYDGTFYAAPITKAIKEDDQQRYLMFKANIDVDYTDARYTGGTVLLKKGRYICQERIIEVVGKVRPEFFNKLLVALPETVRFSHSDYAEKLYEKFGDVENDDSMLFTDEIPTVTSKENFEVEENTTEEATSERMEECNTSDTAD